MTALRRTLPEVTSLALVVATAAVGLLLAPMLPEQMIVGWHLGLDGQVSVTRGPRLLGLVLLPTITAAMYVGLRITRLLLDTNTPSSTRYFEVLAHLLLGLLALGQGWLLVMNL